MQLINKTNQFNLTTRRVTDEEIAALIEDDRALTLQIRLTDTFGDNGIIAIVIGLFEPGTRDIRLDTWLMSCRVLGRRMEEETLNLVVAQARALGAERLIGVYRPTAKNGMVREHYAKLGFVPVGPDAGGRHHAMGADARRLDGTADRHRQRARTAISAMCGATIMSRGLHDRSRTLRRIERDLPPGSGRRHDHADAGR